MGSLALYLRYVNASIRGQMQYRASFAMQALGGFLINGAEFVGLWILFDRFGSIGGWTLPEIALLYGLVHVAFALADGTSGGFDSFGSMVRTGEFDRLLLRPRSTILQVAGLELALRRVGRLAQGLLVFFWGAHASGVVWTAPHVALVVAAAAGGACLFYALFVLQATLAFWTTESLEVVNVLTYGGVETGQYPLPIYRTAFRRFFTGVVPLACVNYYPILVLLGRTDPCGAPAWLGWVSPLAGPVFLGIATRFWALGVRRYTSTGS